jgi:4-amino-4-deoxy-L-arabinose transferase-like glycosyltransferase
VQTKPTHKRGGRGHQHSGNQETTHQSDYRTASASGSLYWELLSETAWKRWTIGLALAAALFFLYFFGLTRTGLVGPDEPRYAAIGRAMAQTGDWVTPRLWGKSWFEKPPLLYWMTAAGFKAGLDQDLAPRLPVALLSVAFLIYFFVALRREFGERAAFYATTILGTSAGWLAYSHVAVTDLPMSAALSAAMFMVLRAVTATTALPHGRGSVTPFRIARVSKLSAGVLLGLAVLGKGLVPLALFLPAVWLMRRRIRDLLVIFGAATAVAAPWYALVTWRNGTAFLEELFVKQTFARFASATLGHQQPFWFYLPVLLAGLFPWTPFLALLFQKRIYKDNRAVFLLAWFVWGFVFFSVFLNKLPGYLLPLLPAGAALLGILIASAQERSAKIVALIAASAALLWCVPAIQDLLPQALLSGISHAQIHVPVAWILPALAVIACCALLERMGRRTASVALIGLVTALSVVRLVFEAYPVLDHTYSARASWISHAGSITCVSKENRSRRYGLNYYAGRDLPDCN